jgi:hypothetical protein
MIWLELCKKKEFNDLVRMYFVSFYTGILLESFFWIYDLFYL